MIAYTKNGFEKSLFWLKSQSFNIVIGFNGNDCRLTNSLQKMNRILKQHLGSSFQV